jgi:ATP synthase protein I
MTSTPASGVLAVGAPLAVVTRGALLPTAVFGGAAAVLLSVLRGAHAIPGAVLGLVVGLGFFASGMLVVTRFARDVSPVGFVAIGMGVYLGQVLVLLLFMLAFYNAAWLDGPAFGWVVLVVTIAWQVFSIRTWRRARIPVYDEKAL